MDSPGILEALIAAEEILEILNKRGTLGLERESSAERVADVFNKVQAAKKDAAGLTEERRENENFPYGLEIGISTCRGQGHADCNKCNISEYGCYADLVKWAHQHAKDVHDWAGSTSSRRLVGPWQEEQK